MEPNTLSSRDLAKLLDLNVSTIKRWADGGELPCIRTPGGHRRFRLDDVQGFLTKRGINPRSLAPVIPAEEEESRLESAILHRHWQWLQEHLLSLALDGHVRRTTRLFTAMYLAGIHPAELCDNLIAPAMSRVGQQWAINRLTIADEHLATHTVSASLAEMSIRWHAQQQVNLRALCGCMAPDLHELATLCIGQVLQYEGWNIATLGANTPVESFISAMDRLRVDVVCVTATVVPDPVSFRADVKRLAHAARAKGSSLVVGGGALPTIELDGAGTSLMVLRSMGELVEYAREVLDDRRRKSAMTGADGGRRIIPGGVSESRARLLADRGSSV